MNTQRCANCGSTAPEHFVACPQCHALFHAQELGELLRKAQLLEASGDAVGALNTLRAMQPLLPANAAQAKELRTRIAALEPKAGSQSAAPSNAPKWLAGLGAAGLLIWKLAAPLLLLLSKAKFLLVAGLKLPTLLSFAASAALWRDGRGGVAVALVILGSIYVHEIGHMWAFRRYGIAVSPPMFVPGLGAFVRGSHYPTSGHAIGDVALSGPIWGGVSGVLVLLSGVILKQPWLCAASMLIAEINLFNLLPVWQLDGGRAVAVISKRQVLMLGGLTLTCAALALSPMAAVAGVGLVVRRFVHAPAGDGDRRTFGVFGSLVLGLIALRVLARFAT